MSRLRHNVKHRMAGGLTSKPQWNAGGSQNAAKEAEELKHGGKAKHHGEGEHAKKRHDRPKRAKGGVVGHASHHPYGKDHDGGTHADGLHVDGTGGKAHHHMAKRAHGGALNKPVHEGHPHHMMHPHKRAAGGAVQARKKGGAVHDGIEHPDGDVHHHSSHRPHRARGGRLRGEGIGSERTPLTGAAKIKEVVPGELPPHGVRSD